MNRSLLVFYFIFSISVSAESSKVICELNGEYSITFKDLKKTYLSEGIEFFKNLARQTQQSLFLLDRAKTSFAESDWSRDKVYIVQYWDLDTDNETLQSLKYSIEPSPIWIYPDAASRIELSSEGPAVTHFIDNGDQHPLFDLVRVNLKLIFGSNIKMEPEVKAQKLQLLLKANVNLKRKSSDIFN